MRLSRLDLTRYGLFTDRTIDFGPLVPGQPDLHVIYGPNEAGKSTVLSALLDLMFEIEVKSRYDFVHPYKSMAVGARLDVSDRSWEAVRVKRRNDSLVDPAGRPLDEGFLKAALSGLDRETYRMMFSLDDKTLEEGGESILASRGDLGRILFAATAGLAEFGDTLLALRDEADAFHKLKGRSGELGVLKARLLELRKRRDEIDTVAAHHARLVQDRAATRKAYERARCERIEAQGRTVSLRARTSALPHLATLTVLRDELSRSASLPDAPASWWQDLPGLLKEGVELSTRLEGVDEDVAGLEAVIEGVSVDHAALSASDRIGRLPDLRSRHLDAEDELPGLRARLRQEDAAIGGILRDLDRGAEADPRRLLIGKAVTAAFRELMERRSGIVEALRKSAEDVAEAERSVDEARDDVEGGEAEPGRAADVILVRNALTAAQAGGQGALAAAAGRSLERKRGLLDDALLSLRPWSGSVDDLAALVVPEKADVESWEAGLVAAVAEKAREADEAAALEEERACLQADLEASSMVVGFAVLEGDPGSVRGDRERLWANHRRTLDPGSADDFEQAMRRDDVVTVARIGHEAELARLRQVRERVAVASAGITRATAARDGAAERSRSLLARMAEAWLASGGAWPRDATPAWLEGWLSRRVAALDHRDGRTEAEAEVRAVAMAVEASRAEFRGILASARIPHDDDAGIEGLAAVAQAFLDHEAELAGRRRRLADLGRDLATRRSSSEKAERTDREWQDGWRATCRQCWFGASGAVRSVVDVRSVIDALSALEPRVKDRDALVDQIRAMEEERASFAREVAEVSALVTAVDATGSSLDVARRLEAAARLARTQTDDLLAKGVKLEAALARRARLRDALALHARKAGEMTTLFAVADLADVEGKLATLARRADLRERAERAERDLVDALGTSSLAEAETLVRGLDRETMKGEMSEAQVLLDERERLMTEAFAQHRRAVERVDEVGGDEEVARMAAAKRTILLEVEDKALRCLRLRMGVMAAERAIDLYRDQHKSTMMSLASESFSALSRGAYVRLTSRFEKTGETLIALTHTGSRTALELSKGTRFQLYLALRVAAYQEYVRSRPSVPFVADDILETFDDFRAEEAFAAFARMAGDGQVVYLTHHPHLCRIAAAVCPTIRIHELEPLPA